MILNWPKIENSDRKTVFSKHLSEPLSKTTKFKLKQLLKEIPNSPPETGRTNNTCLKNLDLRANNKEIILSK